MSAIQRKGRDHDPVHPWVWATVPLKSEPVEILSYPIPHKDSGGIIDDKATIMIRTRIGDPASIREIPFKLTACFHPSRMGGKIGVAP